MPDIDTDFTNSHATFGDRIVAAREALGMSAHDLAKRLGVRAQSVEAWEADRSEPRANRLQMLAGVLNVSIIWLMSGEGPGVPPETQSAGPTQGLDEVIAELRAIRAAQTELAQRSLRLERRLIGMRD